MLVCGYDAEYVCWWMCGCVRGVVGALVGWCMGLLVMGDGRGVGTGGHGGSLEGVALDAVLNTSKTNFCVAIVCRR